MFYLAAAFIAVWVAVTLYVVFMSRRQRDLEEELGAIEELVASLPAKEK